MGVTQALAQFALGMRYDTIPAEAVGRAKELALDSLGGMLGGSRERVSRIAMSFARQDGGPTEAGVVGGGFRTSLNNAVFVNATSAHAQELETEAKFHGGVALSIVPCALSLAEKYGLPGKAVVEAIALGQEIHGKLGFGAPGGSDRGYVGITLYGPIAVAAMTARVLGLNEEQTRMAMSLAANQAGGFHAQGGYMAHLFDGGNAGRIGITSALLAKEGATANPEILESPVGFLELFCRGGRGFDPEKIVADLGNPFYILSPGVGMKKYGCCGRLHKLIDATFQLIEEHGIEYDQVENVEIELGAMAARNNRFTDPENGEQAKFSPYQALGAALVDRKPDLPYVRPFTDQGIAEPRYREARKKIKVVVCPDRPGEERQRLSPVTIRLKDGRVFSKVAAPSSGSPGMPFTREELTTRFANCAQGVVPPRTIQRLVELTLNLEQLGDLRELMQLATCGRSRRSSQTR